MAKKKKNKQIGTIVNELVRDVKGAIEATTILQDHDFLPDEIDTRLEALKAVLLAANFIAHSIKRELKP